MITRHQYVIDPVWRVLDWASYALAWKTLIEDASRCGFVGFDLEWTTLEEPPGSNDTVDSAHANAGPRVQAVKRKPKRFTGPVATVQLSTHRVALVIRYCDLWHLVKGETDSQSCWQGDPFSPASDTWPNHRLGEKTNNRKALAAVLENLNHFLRNEAIVKVGVGVGGDKAKLQRDYAGQVVHPCVDLATLACHYIRTLISVRLPSAAHQVYGTEMEVDVREVRSLKEMAAVFCGTELEKDISVVKSDWGGALGALSPMQIQYAARDAEVSFDACAGIIEVAVATSHSEVRKVLLGQRPREANCLSLLTPLVISTDTSDDAGHGGNGTRATKATLTQRLQSHNLLNSVERAEESATEVNIGWCKGRSKRYYDNINVYDPDMQLVFTVDQVKAEWYVLKKGIAEVVEWRAADPTFDGSTTEKQIAAIKLSFSPDFRKFNDSHIRRNLEYFQQPKENVCVVCGAGGSLVRFAVIPMMYRKYFPSVYMSHNSYDLLLLCTSCFARSRGIYEEERQTVSRDFGIPLAHLTPARLAAFEQEIEAVETEIAAAASTAITACSDDSEPSIADDDLIAHHLPRALRARAMREFAEVERHRECLLTILKYAKALHSYYITTGEDSGKPLTGDRRYPIPANKVALMRYYVEEHAPRYPFGPGSANAGTEATRDETGQDGEAFAAIPGGPSSPEGVRWIMCGGERSGDSVATSDTPAATSPATTGDGNDGRGDSATGAARLRSVLTNFWFRTNPQLTGFVPRTVRAEEKNGVPLVDSHGFFIVRMLMEKYAGSTEKNGEHAVGQFIFRWREVFLSKLQPRHLPNGWVAEDGILR